MKKFWKKSKNIDQIYPILERMRFFLKKWAPSLLCVYSTQTSCKKLEKRNEPILKSLTLGPKMTHFNPSSRTVGPTNNFELRHWKRVSG